MEETTEIRNICEQIAQVYRDKMSNAGYDPNGELMKFTWVTEYNGNLFQLYFNLPNYWQYAEYGRGPGKMPPVNKILKWIEFKHLVPHSNNGRVPTTVQLAFAISKHIAKYGTQGKHLLQETIQSTYNNLVDQLVNLIAKQLEKEINEDIDNL